MKQVLLILLIGLLAVGVAPLAAQQRDSDGDGIADTRDHCPNQAGTPANNGCPPNGFAPNPQQPTPVPPRNPGNPSGESGGGTPVDSDGDGTPDGSDACPNAGGPAQRNGCPDTTQDSDGDTIPDPVDACPNVGGTVDSSGCPVFTAPALPQDVCAVTASGDYLVNVRLTPNTDAEVLGYLLPGVVYNALGVVVVDAELWFVLSEYDGSTGSIGYAAQSVLNAAACAELFAASAQNNLKQIGLAIHNFDANAAPPTPPTHEPYRALLELACDGGYVLFRMVDANGVEEPNSFGGDCLGDDTALLPPAPLQTDAGLFEMFRAEIETCAQALNHGVTVLAWARVDGVSPAPDDVVVDGRIITAENFDSAFSCGTSLDEFIGQVGSTNAGHEKHILIESWSLGSATPFVGGWGSSMYQYAYNDPIAALCESDALSWWDVDSDGNPIRGTLNVVCLPVDPGILPDGIGFGTPEAANPFDLTAATDGSSRPMELLSLNFTKVTFSNLGAGLELDLRGTEIGGTQDHDDGSTTVEYCIYVELYEVGVFNKVCYEVEVPPNCELVSSEAGVYTVVCDGEGNVSLNPEIDGLPALDMTVPSREQAVLAADYLLRLDGIKGEVK